MTVKEYLISVTAAAIICGIIRAVVSQKGSIASAVRMMSGLFMVIVMIAPIVELQFNDLQVYTDGLLSEAEYAASIGQSAASKEIELIIKEQTQAYVQEKAAELGVDICVEVELSQKVPCEIQITGAVSPYVKKQLSKFIENNIGILSEDQIWIG